MASGSAPWGSATIVIVRLDGEWSEKRQCQRASACSLNAAACDRQPMDRNSLSALAFITYPLSMASMALSFLAKTQYFLHPLRSSHMLTSLGRPGAEQRRRVEEEKLILA